MHGLNRGLLLLSNSSLKPNSFKKGIQNKTIIGYEYLMIVKMTSKTLFDLCFKRDSNLSALKHDDLEGHDIVNRREMVRKPGKHQRSKQRGQDLGWKLHDRAHLLSCSDTLCMSYIIQMFLLVNCMNTRNHLLYFVRFCARSTPKIANKKL